MNSDELLQRALAEVDASPAGHLSLATRGDLWRSMGPADVTDGCVRLDARQTFHDLVPGHRRRVALVAQIAKHVVLPIWEQELARWMRDLEPMHGPLCNDDDRADRVIALALAEHETTGALDARADRYGNFLSYVSEVWPHAPRAALCLEFAGSVLGVRLHDLIAWPDDDEEGSDRWAPDVYACWAFAGSSHLYAGGRSASDDEIEQRRAFWRQTLGFVRTLRDAPEHALAAWLR